MHHHLLSGCCGAICDPRISGARWTTACLDQGFFRLHAPFFSSSSYLLGLLDVQLDKQPRPSKLMKNLDLKCQTIQYYVSESYFLIPLPSQLKEMDHLAGRMTVKIEDLGDQEFSAMEIDPDAKIPIIFLREHVEVFGRFKSIYFVNTRYNRDLILSMQDSWKNIFRPGIQDVASAGEYRMLLPKIYSILQFQKIQKVIHLQRSGEIMSSWEDFQRESLNLMMMMMMMMMMVMVMVTLLVWFLSF